ncbi:hypothetical protein PQX77_001295 [Marasmius sp. AFHP31]|nr:hypothetical protein PQX77_001295 [Marasmius sp. AFHP31]
MSNGPHSFPNHPGSPQHGYSHQYPHLSYPPVDGESITINEEHYGDTFGSNSTVGWVSRDHYSYRDDRGSVLPPPYNQDHPQTRSGLGGGSPYPQHQHQYQSATRNVVYNRSKFGEIYGDGTRAERITRDRYENLAPNTPIHTPTLHLTSTSTRAAQNTGSANLRPQEGGPVAAQSYPNRNDDGNNSDQSGEGRTLRNTLNVEDSHIVKTRLGLLAIAFPESPKFTATARYDIPSPLMFSRPYFTFMLPSIWFLVLASILPHYYLFSSRSSYLTSKSRYPVHVSLPAAT